MTLAIKSLFGSPAKLLASAIQIVGLMLVTAVLAYMVNPSNFSWAWGGMFVAAMFGDVWGTFWTGVRDRTR